MSVRKVFGWMLVLLLLVAVLFYFEAFLTDWDRLVQKQQSNHPDASTELIVAWQWVVSFFAPGAPLLLLALWGVWKSRFPLWIPLATVVFFPFHVAASFMVGGILGIQLTYYTFLVLVSFLIFWNTRSKKLGDRKA